MIFLAKKLLLIANPHSGQGMIRGKLLPIVDILTKAGYEVTVHVTRCQGDATIVAKTRGADFSVVVACGGDGTVNEIVTGIATMDNPPVLGIIPAGSVNDYAYSIGMPKGIIASAKALADGTVLRCDTGFIDGTPFAYCAAFGLFTDVPYVTPQDMKKVLGPIAYGLQGLLNLNSGSYRKRHFTVEYDDGVIEDDFLLGVISNTVSIGGVRKMFDQVASLDDGKIEITLIKTPHDLVDIQKIINVLLQIDHVENIRDFVTVINTSHARLVSDSELRWTVDGEDGGLRKETEITVRHSNIPVIRGNTDKVYSEAPIF